MFSSQYFIDSVTKTEKSIMLISQGAVLVMFMITGICDVFWSRNLRDLAANMHILF